MQFKDKRSFEQSIREAEYGSPPAPLPRQSNSGMVTLGLSIFAGIMFMSLFFSGINVAITVVSTAVVYGGIITLVLLIDSGTLAYWLGKRAEERTRREEMHLAYGYHTQRMSGVEGVQEGYALPTPAQPQLPASRFVPAVAPGEGSVQREAVAWVLQLYTATGDVDPDKVLTEKQTDKPDQVGRIRGKRPSRQATQWLLDHRILKPTSNGYRLNSARYPTRDHAKNYFATLAGAGSIYPSPTVHPHPLTTGQEVSYE